MNGSPAPAEPGSVVWVVAQALLGIGSVPS